MQNRRKRIVLAFITVVFLAHLTRVPQAPQQPEPSVRVVKRAPSEAKIKVPPPSPPQLGKSSTRTAIITSHTSVRGTDEASMSPQVNAAVGSSPPVSMINVTALELTDTMIDYYSTALSPLQIPKRSKMYRCTGGCGRFNSGRLQVGHQRALQGECYYGDMVPLRRRGSQMKQWISYGRNITKFGNITTVPGSIVAFRSNFQASGHNINHGFHDDFTTLLSTFSQDNIDKNFTLIYQVASSWLQQVLLLSAATFGWQRVREAKPYEIVCAQDGTLLLNGFARDNGKPYLTESIPRLREAAWNHLGSIEPRPTKPRVFVYTRLDSAQRQLRDANSIVQLFDESRIDSITIVDSLPTTMWEQVRLFRSMDILIAPNGGWAPNVMWMPPHACLIEIHLYNLDSWIQMFGLHQLFEPNHFVTLVGEFNDPTVKRQKQGITRKGGDDTILVSQVLPALQKLAMENSQCLGAFFKPTVNASSME